LLREKDKIVRVKAWLSLTLGLITAALFGAAMMAALPQQSKRTRKLPVKSAPPASSPSSTADATANSDEVHVSVEGIRANNLGVALMDEHNFSEAVGRFQTACIMVPDSDTGCLNAGIALVAMKQFEQARKLLTTSLSRDPQSARALFNLGLLDRAQDQTDAALAHFEEVAALDPNDAATRCVIGNLQLTSGKYDDAASAFRAALKIDPLIAAAETGLAEVFENKNDPDNHKIHLDRAKHLTSLGLGQTLGDGYGEQGKYSLAAEIPTPDIAGPALAIHFLDVTESAGLTLPTHAASSRGSRPRSQARAKNSEGQVIHSISDFLGSGACVFDFDGDGRPDIFLVDADGQGNAALYHNLGHGRFLDVTKASKIDFHAQGMGCAVCDYDDDGHPDLAVSFNGGVRLFHNEGDGTFSDVTEASGIRADGLVMGLSFVDYDRDGDLDLYLTRFHDLPLEHASQPFAWPEDAPAGNMLWRNHGDGTFSDVTEALGLAGDSSSTGAIASDFARTGGLDLLLTGLGSTPDVLMNPREGAFQSASIWGAESQKPTAAGVALDFDKDGYMDIALTHWAPTTLGLWRNADGKSFDRVALPDPGWMRAWGIAALDYDNDGWIDLVAVGETFSGEGRIALLRNEGAKGFHDVSAQTGLDKITLHDPRSVIAFDGDGDGSLELLITENHRAPALLKAVGGNKNNWSEITLRGDSENTMGLGVPVEIFSGAQRQTWEVPGASGYLSQGPATIKVGLGEEARADAVRVRWSQGPRQVQIPLLAGQKVVISQQDASPTQ
jgi:tetratricopeptide (TPR) repeat protein